MDARRRIASLACLAALAGCASTASVPDMAALGILLNNAETAQKAGENEKAVALLQEAARGFPAEKMPWLRLAQLRFETKNYGEAVTSAQQVLERDPDETLAHSIIAVSSLRLASKALADLSQKNNMTGNINSEARELAKLLRSALGEEKLVPARGKAPGRAVLKK